MLNRTFRDVLKQMQTLAREHRSNIKDEEVNLYKDIIQKNDEYIKGNITYLNAIKDLAVQKDYLIQKKEEFIDALADVADKRSIVIKKALNAEKAKNKLIDGDKLNILDQELNDVQRDFDRAREIFIKKIHQFIEVRDEINTLWIKLKYFSFHLYIFFKKMMNPKLKFIKQKSIKLIENIKNYIK